MIDEKALKKILIADHNDHTRRILSYFLTKEGYAVETMNNGPDATAGLSSHKPDIVVIDVGLPGMDAFDVLRAAVDHPRRREMSFIILSTVKKETARLKGASFGAEEYITKPFSNQMLLKTIKALLDKKNGE